MTKAIAFVIPVRNDAAALARCLLSIGRQTGGASVQVVVADNGSTDGSAATARALGAEVLELPDLKVGELRNRAAAEADARVLAFVDADHELGAGWITAALETLQDPAVAATGCPYSPPSRPTWVQRIYNAFRRHEPGSRPVEWLGAGNLALKREVFLNVGGFDVSLEACEDVDLCQRLRHAGFSVVSDSRLQSLHYGDPSSLKALFISELWRGRDNLRVSLRGPLSLRAMPSILIPLVDLAALIALMVSAVLFRSPALTMTALAALLVPAALRAAGLFAQLRDRTAADLGRTLLVACAYDLARALALVTRFPHRRAGGHQAPAVAG